MPVTNSTELQSYNCKVPVDVAAELTAGKDFVLDPAEAARVRYVALHTLLPAVCRARETWAETRNGLHCVGGRSTGT